jgi:hypothetical protein
MASDMVDKVSKLLNQAERAPEGSPEREAFMAKAVTLSQAYAIDLAIARAHQAKKEQVEQPEQRSFKVGQDRLSPTKNAHFVDLMLAICSANDIECTISGSNMYVFGVGMPSDLDMAERFFAILAPQMIAEADAGLKRGDNGEWSEEPKRVRVLVPEDERAWGKHDGSDSWGESCHYDERDESLYDGMRRRPDPYTGYIAWVKSYPPPAYRLEVVRDEAGEPVLERKWVSREDARIWRVNFYKGFVSRTRQRLHDLKRQALKDAGIEMQDTSDSRSLALRDKKKAVRDVYEEQNRAVLATGRTYGGAEVSRHSYAGHAAGHDAGGRAKLGSEKDLA